MKIKVGNKTYDGAEEPVMVILSDVDKKNIAAMDPNCSRFCVAPDTVDVDELKRWMEEE